MRIYQKIIASLLVAAACFACAGGDRPRPKTDAPLDTLKIYGAAFKKKDSTTMKQLLSAQTLKMHEQEARAQNVTVDDIVKRDTLFSESQTTAEFRNQRIEDEQATIEMKDSGGLWNTIHFVREDGAWKIDRREFVNQIEQDVEQNEKKFDEIFNANRQP